MRVLLTGATGLVGTAVRARLLADGHEVLALARPGRAPADRAGWVEHDLVTGRGDVLPAPLDGVVHLAASRRHRDFPDGASEVLAVSAGATVRLLEHARSVGARRLVLGSSGAVYAPAAEPLAETTPPDPPSFYGECKLAAERLAARFGPEVSALALRFFFVYGPGQEASMFIPGLAGRLARDEPVRLAGADGLRTTPVYVDDAAAAVVAALSSSLAGACNVAGPEVASLRALATAVAEVTGGMPRFDEGPPGLDLVADTERMRAELHVPRVGLDDGLRRTFSR